VGRIQVQPPTVPTASPTPLPQPTALSTPTQGSGQTGSGLLAILRELWAWLRSWITRLRYFAYRNHALSAVGNHLTGHA